MSLFTQGWKQAENDIERGLEKPMPQDGEYEEGYNECLESNGIHIFIDTTELYDLLST